MKEWWLGLVPRERRAVVLGGVVVVAMLFYVLLWQPLHRRIAELQQRIEAQLRDLDYLERAASQVIALKARQSTAGAPEALYALVERSAGTAGLADAIRRIDPAGDGRVRVGLEQAGFDAMIRWLTGLRRNHGVVVATASVRRSDRPGRVSVQLVLKTVTQ